jgi:hypothetical protein
MATANSNQYANQIAVSRSGSPSVYEKRFFEGATASAITGTINLIKLPPGKIRILPKDCGFMIANGAATANMSIGYAAYTAANGVAVAADVDALVAEALVNAHTGIANWATGFVLPANGGLEIDSLEGVVMTCTIGTANTAAAGEYSGAIGYLKLG